MVNFSFQNFHQVFFFKTRTHAQICLNFHPNFFQNTHTRTDMSEFSSVFFFKTRTDMNFTNWLHRYLCYKGGRFFIRICFQTRTHAQIWILQSGLFVSSQNVWIVILVFFRKDAHTYRYRCYKDGRFSIRILFSKHAHTHRYELYKVAYLFHLKMSEFLFLLFSKKTHTRTDIDVIKMAEFSSAFSFQNTHTQRDMNFTKWLFCFISKCLSLLFSENTHTRTDIDVNNMIKMADFFIPIFSENTHTRTDMNFTKWLICFISKCLNFYLCFFLKIRTHAQISMLPLCLVFNFKVCLCSEACNSTINGSTSKNLSNLNDLDIAFMKNNWLKPISFTSIFEFEVDPYMEWLINK